MDPIFKLGLYFIISYIKFKGQVDWAIENGENAQTSNFGFWPPLSKMGGATDAIMELRPHFVLSNIVFKYKKDRSRET